MAPDWEPIWAALRRQQLNRERRLMLTVLVVLALVAFACTIAAAMGKCPLWVAVLLLTVIELLRQLPFGKA